MFSPCRYTGAVPTNTTLPVSSQQCVQSHRTDEEDQGSQQGPQHPQRSLQVVDRKQFVVKELCLTLRTVGSAVAEQLEGVIEAIVATLVINSVHGYWKDWQPITIPNSANRSVENL